MRGNWLDIREREAVRRGAAMGGWIATVATVLVMCVVHVMLSSYADGKHQQAIASIRQADALLMQECKAIVVDLGEPESGTYEEVRDYKRAIVALQGKN